MQAENVGDWNGNALGIKRCLYDTVVAYTTAELKSRFRFKARDVEVRCGRCNDSFLW